MQPGSIVRCRNREWVLMPGDQAEVFLLRPLTGATDEVVGVHKELANLIGSDLPAERVGSASFPLPTEKDLSDAASSHLLWQAARLTLREGVTPFRSLGRISIRPRTYQFVPLLMALRLDPIRLLIADDVGVGKTIEALLIAREMFERGEIKRLCVLVPPCLCDQWQAELSKKFNMEAVVIRSGTINQLERRKVGPDSIYKAYPLQVASIDFLKSDRNKHAILLDCPDLVIVDEAHGSALASGRTEGQHQRHQLVHEIAKRPDQHLILVTATPHSGIEGAFRSLLTLLRPEFGKWDTTALSEPQRVELARHFVQRTRFDIKKEWEGEDCFPERIPSDETYHLSKPYQELFSKTYAFCSELVRSSKDLGKRQQRVRYWGALALLRCVMSSPNAALAALENRHKNLPESEDEPDFRSFVFESTDEQTDDSQPTPPIEAAEATMQDSDRRQLAELGRLAAKLAGSSDDLKLTRCAEIVSSLLKKGFHPIVWCRYIATANYLCAGLQLKLASKHADLRVIAVTSSNLDDEERRAAVDQLSKEKCRVLIATDCLSEGINLQDAFDAALHYDLPWNPNRLEQREGRVDRYGQPSSKVQTIRFFSPDSAVDGVVIEVLLNKAREIHRTLGTHVPVPEESESVTEAVLNALFLRGAKEEKDSSQLELGLEIQKVKSFHQRWELDAEREKQNRTRFAQRALKPAEVARELDATDAVLGDPKAVREFVLNAAQRIGLTITPGPQTDTFRLVVTPEARATLPSAISFALPTLKTPHWLISFVSPTPKEADYVGRNHRFVVELARFLMEEALTKGSEAHASRCGVIRTKAVSRLTTILLLRARYLVNQPKRASLLAEEVQVAAWTPAAKGKEPDWLPDDEALRLLAEATPDANVPLAEKRERINEALAAWPALEPSLKKRIEARAGALEESHRRIRQAVSLRVRELSVTPQLPPDLLGVLVLQPSR